MASCLIDISTLPNACVKLKSRGIFNHNTLKSPPFSSAHLIQVIDAELDFISSRVRGLPAYLQPGRDGTKAEAQVAFYSLILLRLCQQSRNLSNGIRLADCVCVPTDQAMSEIGLDYMTRRTLRILTDNLRRTRLDRTEFTCLFYLLALDIDPAKKSQEFEERYLGLLRMLQIHLESELCKRSLIEERLRIILAVKKTLKLFSQCFFDNIMLIRRRTVSHKLRTFS